jgi:Flp pilus assembly protein TadG
MSYLHSALKDRRASVAVEFVLVIPILIVLFLGIYEVTNAVILYMKVIDAADTVSDLAAQYTTVASADIDNFYIAGQLVMEPSPGSGLGLAIASVAFDPNTGKPSIAWQATRGGAQPMTDAASAAVGFGSPGDSVIEATASYTYTSLFGFVLPYGITMSTRVFSRPRNVSVIPCSAPCN